MAAYKRDTLTTHTVEWQSKLGDELKVEVALHLMTSDYYGNGDYKADRDGPTVQINTYVAGKQTASGTWVKGAPKGVPAHIVGVVGNIGLDTNKLAAVNAAIARTEAHPAYVAKLAAQERGRKACEEYEAHSKAVDNMMTLGGRTY